MGDVKLASDTVNTAGQTDKKQLLAKFENWKLYWHKPHLQIMDQLMNLFKIVCQLCSLEWAEKDFAGDKMYRKVMEQVHADIKTHLGAGVDGRSEKDIHRKLYFEQTRPHASRMHC